MAKPRFTLYKHIKIGGTWRYCRAAVAINNKVKPHIVVVGGTEEKHEDGSYCVRHKNQWIEVGNDPAEALRRRTKLSEQESPAQQTAPASGAATGTPLAEAAETYFKSRSCDEAREPTPLPDPRFVWRFSPFFHNYCDSLVTASPWPKHRKV